MSERSRRRRAMTWIGLACLAMGGVILQRILLWGTLLAFELAWLDSDRSIDADPGFVVAIDRWTLALSSLVTIMGAVLWIRSGGRSDEEATGAENRRPSDPPR